MFTIYKPMPLTRMSLVAVSKYLWGSRNLPKITEYERFGLEFIIVNSLPQLGLPVTLRKDLESVVMAMGDSLNMWRENTRKAERQMLSGNVSLYKRVTNEQIIWTQQGEVVRDAMAFWMVQDECLNIYEAYRLSCYYCLHNFSRFLFKQYNADVQRILLQDPNYAVNFWTHLFMGMNKPTGDTYKHLFVLSLKDRNLFGAEYFWKKMAKNERETYLMDGDFGPLWGFAFHANDLNPSERGSFFTRYGGVFIRRLVQVRQYEYIYREAFFKTMCWIDDEELALTTWNIAMPFFESWPSCYRKDGESLFLSMWNSIPAKRKKAMMSHSSALLLFISHPRNVRMFRTILADIDKVCDRSMFLKSNNGMILLECLIRYRRLEAFKTLVGNCVCPMKIRRLLLQRRRENLQLDPLHHTKDATYTKDLNSMLRWFRQMP